MFSVLFPWRSPQVRMAAAARWSREGRRACTGLDHGHQAYSRRAIASCELAAHGLPWMKLSICRRRSRMPATSILEITIDRIADAVVVRIKGEAPVRNVDDMERQLRPVAALRSSLVVFDLSGLSFISSLGMSVLVNLHRGIERNGATVRFAAAQPAIGELFATTRLDTVFQLCPSVDEAIAGL